MRLFPIPAWRPALLPVLLLAAAASAQTSDPAGQAVSDTGAALDARAETQQDLDAWAREKAELQARYAAAQSDVAWLERRRDEQGARLAALEGRVNEMRRRLDEADRLESSMQDTLQVIFERLEASVDASLPFLPDERRARLDDLQAELRRPDVTAAEKLRRLLEALQVEAAYAGTVEVYQDEIDVDGGTVHADVLRLGAVALFWRAPDGDRAGLYNQAAGRWTVVSGAAARRITLAMEMAARTRPMEVVPLPLGRIAATDGGAP